MLDYSILEAFRDLSIDEDEVIEEDIASSMPVTILSPNDIENFARSQQKATSTTGPVAHTFNIGYISDVTNRMVAAAYRGPEHKVDKETGELLPIVRLFKCSEYTKAYLENYSDSKDTKRNRAGEDPETEHHRTGYEWVARGIFKSIKTGDLALGPLFQHDFKVKVKYFVSIDDGDLQETSLNDIAQYLTGSALSPRSYAPKLDDQGNPIITRPTVTLPFKGIYMLGNMGHSII